MLLVVSRGPFQLGCECVGHHHGVGLIARQAPHGGSGRGAELVELKLRANPATQAGEHQNDQPTLTSDRTSGAPRRTFSAVRSSGCSCDSLSATTRAT